ncbi:MAG: cell division protein FtsA [bacterium]|nr:cell division protein FtsA [bacterium]
MRKIYTSIDIGTDTIKFVVGEVVGKEVVVLASYAKKSSGIRKGLIVDANLAINAIKDGSKEVENLLGIPIKKVIVGVPAYDVKFILVNESLDLSDEGVTSFDVNKIIKNSVYKKIDPDFELVTVIPINFTVDDIKNLEFPVGIKGKKLLMKGIIVSVPQKNVYSVVSVVVGAGLEVVDITLSGIGDYYEVRNNQLDKQVGAVINLGHQTTTVSIVNKAKLMNTSVIQLGGKNIDNDLSVVFGINVIDAREMKEKFGCAHKRFTQLNDVYEVKNSNGEMVKINQLETCEVIMSRLKEIMAIVKKQILSLTKQSISYVIITGGMTEIKSFKYLAYEIFGKDVIIYSIPTLGVRDNKYTTSLGMIKYFHHKMLVRGKDYSMVNSLEELQLVTPSDDKARKHDDTKITKLFGGLFSSKEEK